MRRIKYVVLFLGLLPQPALAGTIQPIVGLPSSYTPGASVSFEIHLPDITNLGSYNIDVALESSLGTAGVDYFFDVAATKPAASQYVFPSSAYYFDSVTVDSPTRQRITLSDFDFSGANVVAGANDRVANVVFRTAASFSSPLIIHVDAPLLILDTPAVTPTPVSGFSTIQNDIAAAGLLTLTAVPEPMSALLLMAGTLVVICSHRNSTFLREPPIRAVLENACTASH